MAKEEEEEEMTCWIFSQFFDGRQNPFYMTTFAFVCRVLFLIVGCDAVGGGGCKRANAYISRTESRRLREMDESWHDGSDGSWAASLPRKRRREHKKK